MRHANDSEPSDDQSSREPPEWVGVNAGAPSDPSDTSAPSDTDECGEMELRQDALGCGDELSEDTFCESTDSEPDEPEFRRRRIRLPLILFAATCVSTFLVGTNHWAPFPAHNPVRQTLLTQWQDGLIYMTCLLGILLTHEMGHFLATIRYRIPASFPYFIPFPISPIGTMGAVIGMDGMRANRKEMFDIGLAGPVAGLLVALPVMWVGISRLDLTEPIYGPYAVDLPLVMRLALRYIQPSGYEPGKLIWFSQLNPYFMAGWVGFLITGLNMLPVSQLDGGHVIYTLFGKRAHWIARIFMVVAVFSIVFFHQWHWTLMVILVFFIGPDHPKTSDDSVPLGRWRYAFGCLGVLIPIFCFAPRLLIFP